MTKKESKPKPVNKAEVSIVLGEPNNYARAMISEVLRNIGYQKIYTATNAAEIIEAANVWHPRVIILENLLPDMQGTELVSRIRRDLIVPDRAVPCIIVTSDPRIETVKNARMAGVDEFAAKPVSHKVIETRLDEVLLRPRPFILAQKYIGPCRRRKRTLSYNGPLKRLNDPTEPVVQNSEAEKDINRRMLIDCTEVMNKFSKVIDPSDRAQIRQLFNSANEAQGIAQRMQDEALELATTCMTKYIQGVGAGGGLQSDVIGTHVHALRSLLDPTKAARAERMEIAKGLRMIVLQKLREAV